MKTNQIMTRKMGDLNVYQRTSDGMFDATSLAKQWLNITGQEKRIRKFLENDQTNDFIQEDNKLARKSAILQKTN